MEIYQTSLIYYRCEANRSQIIDNFCGLSAAVDFNRQTTSVSTVLKIVEQFFKIIDRIFQLETAKAKNFEMGLFFIFGPFTPLHSMFCTTFFSFIGKASLLSNYAISLLNWQLIMSKANLQENTKLTLTNDCEFIINEGFVTEDMKRFNLR